ncbi:MAG: alpha-L-rhamnosidase C-terminal domain-containing protein [Bacteroidales bacterium]
MIRSLVLVWAALTGCSLLQAQLPPVFGEQAIEKSWNDSRVRTYISPNRIVWMQQENGATISHSERLVAKGSGQSDLNAGMACVLKSTANSQAAILLDYGRELQGGIQLITAIDGPNTPIRVRIRLGESAQEAMSTISAESGATNDHAMRDYEVTLPWLGVLEVGNSGFRFARIDLLTPDVPLYLREANAIFTYRDIPYLGSFRSSDERLNQIWMTGAYTVHLNMQEYLWDGIKRDRLVWVGDLHPEVMTVNTVFGNQEVVTKSLDLARDRTPLPGWMNGMSSYSIWWILIHHDWYMYQGNRAYLEAQREYLKGLLAFMQSKVDASGKETLDGGRFLDWPSSENIPGIHAGLQAMMIMGFDAGARLCDILGETQTAEACRKTATLMRGYRPDANGSKQAAALMALAGMIPADEANREVIAVGGAKNFSTFYGYYMLEAQAKAGDYASAVSNIRNYWGAMLDFGATTFWEDFNLDWTQNAAPIDNLVPEGKIDIHGSYGAYCYEKFRHSLCHGWASGPTSWLSRHVLGFEVVEPGCKTVRIVPHLADLDWAEGTLPTPRGLIRVRHEKQPDGTVKSTIKAPKGIKIVRK